MPTSRVAQGVRLLVETAATVDAQEIRMQPVQGISAAGRYVIDGATISAVGTARLAVGQIVPVVFESGRPLVIFALEWQRGRGEVGQEPALGVVEELLLLRAASPDAGSLWFRGEGQIIKLDVVAAAQASSITLGLGNITALKWGEDQNSFVLQGTIPVGQPDAGKVEFFLFSLSRGRAGETVGGVTFLRRERPWTVAIPLFTQVIRVLQKKVDQRVVPKFSANVTGDGVFILSASASFLGHVTGGQLTTVDAQAEKAVAFSANSISDFWLNGDRDLLVLGGSGGSSDGGGNRLSVYLPETLVQPAVHRYAGSTMLCSAWQSVADFNLGGPASLPAANGGWDQWLVNVTKKTVLWTSDKRGRATMGATWLTQDIVHSTAVATRTAHVTVHSEDTVDEITYISDSEGCYTTQTPGDTVLATGTIPVSDVNSDVSLLGLLDGAALPFIGHSTDYVQTGLASAVSEYYHSPRVLSGQLPGYIPVAYAVEARVQITTAGYADVPIAGYYPIGISLIRAGRAATGGVAALPALIFCAVSKWGPDLTFFGKGSGVQTQRWGVFVIDSNNLLRAVLTPGFNAADATTRYKLSEDHGTSFDTIYAQMLSASSRHVLWARGYNLASEVYLSSIVTQETRIIATFGPDSMSDVDFRVSSQLQALPPDMLYEVQSLLRSLAGTKRTTDQRFGVGWDWNTGALDAALTLEPVTLDAAGELLLDGTRPQEDAALAGAGTLVPLGAAATNIVKARSLHGLQIVNSQERLGPAGRYRQEGT